MDPQEQGWSEEETPDEPNISRPSKRRRVHHHHRDRNSHALVDIDADVDGGDEEENTNSNANAATGDFDGYYDDSDVSDFEDQQSPQRVAIVQSLDRFQVSRLAQSQSQFQSQPLSPAPVAAGPAGQSTSSGENAQNNLLAQAFCTLVAHIRTDQAEDITPEQIKDILDLYATRLHVAWSEGAHTIIWECIVQVMIIQGKWTDHTPSVYQAPNLQLARLSSVDTELWLRTMNDNLMTIGDHVRRLQLSDQILDMLVYLCTNRIRDMIQSISLLFAPTLHQCVQQLSSQPDLFVKMKAGTFFRDIPKKNMTGEFVLMVYEELHKLRAMIRGDTIYFPKTENGYDTYAYIAQGSVENVVRSLFSLTHRSDMQNMVFQSGSILNMALETVEKQRQEYYLPEFKPDRSVFSFKDGLYDGHTDKFYPYNSPDLKFFQRKSANFIKHSVQAYVDEENFMKIDCPSADYIIRYQFYQDMQHPTEDEIQAEALLWGMLGRCFFSPLKDRLQRVLMMIGSGGTGKSLLLQQISNAYQSHMVATIGPDNQKTFGMEGLENKFFISVTEVPPTGGLTQETFKILVGLDQLAVNRKNKSTIYVDNFEGQLAFAMNNLPSWNDMGGSVARRYFPAPFMKKPQNQMRDLQTNMTQELGIFIIKACKAYHWMIQETEKSSDFTALWPNMINEFFQSVTSKLNPITCFFNDPMAVLYDPSYKCSYADLQKACVTYMSRNNLGTFNPRDMTFQVLLKSMPGVYIEKQEVTKFQKQIIQDMVIGLQPLV